MDSLPPPEPSIVVKTEAAGNEAISATSSTAATQVKMEVEEELPTEILESSAEDIMTRVRLLDNDVRVSAA